MDTPQLLELLADGPVIAAVKDDDGLKRALRSEAPVLFLLYGDILTIRDTVAQVREAGKRVFVHLDLVEGLSTREISVDFIARSTAADGVISTKAALTRRARELGLVAIQRIFLLDSMALKNLERHVSNETADLVEAHHRRRPDLRQGGRHRGPGGRSGGGVLHQPRCVEYVGPGQAHMDVSGDWRVKQRQPFAGAGLFCSFFV